MKKIIKEPSTQQFVLKFNFFSAKVWNISTWWLWSGFGQIPDVYAQPVPYS